MGVGGEKGEMSQMRRCVVETGSILEKCLCVEGNQVWKEKSFRFCGSRGRTEGVVCNGKGKAWRPLQPGRERNRPQSHCLRNNFNKQNLKSGW